MSESYAIVDSPKRAAGSVIAMYAAAVPPALIAFLIFWSAPGFGIMPLLSAGLWFTAGSLAQCRIFSRYLALQIKALELGLLR